MTDRECLEQILRSLGLIIIGSVKYNRIILNEYFITEDNSIVTGWSKGCRDCDVFFTFDENGKIVNYG